MVGMTLNTMPDIQHRDAEGNLIDNPKLALIGKRLKSPNTIKYFYFSRRGCVYFLVHNRVSAEVSEIFLPFLLLLKILIGILSISFQPFSSLSKNG